MKRTKQILIIVSMLFTTSVLCGQDLDPRAYLRVPVKTTTMITGLSYSYGGVVTDPTLPVKNIKSKVVIPSIGVARAFSLFGLSSQALVVLPYGVGNVKGEVNEQAREINRSGFGDIRMRLSVLFLNAPAATLAQMRQSKARKTILGASVNVVVPSGQYFNEKLINIGTNRWAFRPELALSQPIGKRLMADVYAGVWLFTANNGFFPGNAVRTQRPMGAFQAHLSYNISPFAWVAFDATFYSGGNSTVNGVVNDDRQSNSRIGVTAVVPTGKLSSLKFAMSTGALVRVGQDFTTFSIGWQKSWIPGLAK